MDSGHNIGPSAPVSELGSVSVPRMSAPTPVVTDSGEVCRREAAVPVPLLFTEEGRSTAYRPETEVKTTAVTGAMQSTQYLYTPTCLATPLLECMSSDDDLHGGDRLSSSTTDLEVSVKATGLTASTISVDPEATVLYDLREYGYEQAVQSTGLGSLT